MTLSGEIRYRPEGFRVRETDARPATIDTYFLQRYLFGANVQFGQRARVFGEVQSGIINGRLRSPRPTDSNTLDMHQAFFEWRQPVRKSDRLSVKVGRQELAIGSTRLISASPGLNVKRSFDAAGLAYRAPSWTAVGAFGALVPIVRGTLRRLARRRAALLGRRRRPAQSVAAARRGRRLLPRDRPRSDRNTSRASGPRFGTRSASNGAAPVRALDLNYDGILQWGTFADAPIRGWGFATETGYRIAASGWRPRLSLRADFASGDRDRQDPRLESFNPLFPGNSYSGAVGLFGPTNLTDLTPSLVMAPRPNLTVGFEAPSYWRTSTGDGLYATDLRLLIGPGGRNGEVRRHQPGHLRGLAGDAPLPAPGRDHPIHRRSVSRADVRVRGLRVLLAQRRVSILTRGILGDVVRVRFAPSPTGYLHVGGARTALFNWLFARRHGGRFVLRIEDTDAERSSWDMVAGIVEGLRWLGLDWDEGPDVGGPHAPYFQSQRLEKYRAAAEGLLASGHAVRDEGAIRFNVPSGRTSFTDLVHGPIDFDNEHIEKFVILRSDGHPTYHLSVVVDDIDMEITHVVRGDDHVSNTPKQVLLYEALGRPVPMFAHVPLILGTDKKRLSKRHGATSVTEYQREGYLPEAMVNFLALLGWSPGDDREVLTRDELVAAFTLEGISGGNAVFNPEKLDWFNTQHIARMPAEEIARRIEPQLREAGLWGGDVNQLHAVIDLVKPRLRKIADVVELAKPFLSDAVDPDPAAVARYLSSPELGPPLAALRAAARDARAFRAGGDRSGAQGNRRRSRNQGGGAHTCLARRRHRSVGESRNLRRAGARGSLACHRSGSLMPSAA